MAKSTQNSLHTVVQRLAGGHFLLVAAFGAQIIIFDAWQLITPQAVLARWMAVMFLLATTAMVWYRSHASQSDTLNKRWLFTLIAADIAFASFAVYTQRGMAARAVFLYAIPIIASAALRKRAAIYATAIVCIAAYVTTAVAYFVLNFNEGYKIELYGEVGFYSLLFLVLATLLATATSTRD